MAILVLDSLVGFHIFMDPLMVCINSSTLDLSVIQKLRPGPNFYFESPEQAAIMLHQLEIQSFFIF